MKILLLNLPSPALAEPWTNFPLGLGYVAASIEKRGYDIEVLDLSGGNFKYDLIPQADIYGLSITTPQLDCARELAAHIKAHDRDSIVVAGGPHTLVGKEDFLSDPNFDSVVVEEGEFSFYELVRHYELYGEVERVYWNPPIKLIDDIPFPARHLFTHFKRNAKNTHALLKGDYTEGGQTTIIASRGCPYKCSFCAPHPRKVRRRSPKNVVAELRQIIDDFRIYQFKWQDDTFTLNRKWILELCDLIKKELPETYHRAHTRANVFDDEMASAMKQAGFKVLCFGIESFSQPLLDLNMKAVTIDQIEDSLRIAKKHDFKTVGFLIFGLPGESKQSVTETQRAILRNKRYLDYLNLATMVPLPNTPVWNDPDKFYCNITTRDYSKYWIVAHDHSPDILVKTKGLSESDMAALKLDMYKFMRDQGYSRPEWKN
jgi:radical SAM superfamily enzyme YgiQ (UPF0313 family)